jgi:hypothetical protein
MEGKNMDGGATQATNREAVGVFHDYESLEKAADELESSGFNNADLSLLAGEHAVEEKLGHKYERVEEVEDDPDAPRTAYIERESVGDAKGVLTGGLAYVGAVAAAGALVASGGTLAGALAAAAMAGGASGLVGSVLADLVGNRHARNIEDQLARGGLILWVRTPDTAAEVKAIGILNRHGAEDVHIHSLPAGE